MSRSGPFLPVFELAEGEAGRLSLAVRREGRHKRLRVLGRPSRPEAVQTFLARARAASAIHHPNVLQAHGMGEDDDGPYIWHDHVEGMTAHELVEWEEEPIPIQVAVRAALQVAEGMGAAGALPGGLAARFVLLGFDGIVRLTGLSTGAGDLGYSAPEALRGSPPDVRGDLWSLGVVLHELLAGARLYPREDRESARRILEEPTPDVALEREEVPVMLVELLFELLAKDPDRRPASATVVARRLQDVVTELVAEEGPVEIAAWLGERFGRDRDARRRRIADAVVPLERAGL